MNLHGLALRLLNLRRLCLGADSGIVARLRFHSVAASLR